MLLQKLNTVPQELELSRSGSGTRWKGLLTLGRSKPLNEQHNNERINDYHEVQPQQLKTKKFKLWRVLSRSNTTSDTLSTIMEPTGVDADVSSDGNRAESTTAGRPSLRRPRRGQTGSQEHPIVVGDQATPEPEVIDLDSSDSDDDIDIPISAAAARAAMRASMPSVGSPARRKAPLVGKYGLTINKSNRTSQASHESLSASWNKASPSQVSFEGDLEASDGFDLEQSPSFRRPRKTSRKGLTIQDYATSLGLPSDQLIGHVLADQQQYASSSSSVGQTSQTRRLEDAASGQTEYMEVDDLLSDRQMAEDHANELKAQKNGASGRGKRTRMHGAACGVCVMMAWESEADANADNDDGGATFEAGTSKKARIDSSDTRDTAGPSLEINDDVEVSLLWYCRQVEQDRQIALAHEAKAREQAAAEASRREKEDRAMALALQLQQEMEEDERQAAIRVLQKDCTVCGDVKVPLDFPAKPATDVCQHPAGVCSACMVEWLKSEFDSKGTEGIKCPECTEVLEYADVQRAASLETFEAYDKIAARNALSSLPEFAWCLGAGCKSGQINEQNNDFMDCVSCGYKQCLKHKTPWHTNETCKQYDYRESGKKSRDEEQATEAMLDGVSKKCPGMNCGWRIQKTAGCDHMTCRKCKHEFCWQCLAAQVEIKRVGNTAHATDCKFHSHNLDLAWPFNVHAR